jgi:D-2-hydroxyacid dehydrogenase (NADP+)
MTKINVVLLTPVDPVNLAKMKATGSDLDIIEAAHLMPRFPSTGENPDPVKEKELDILLTKAEILYGFMFPGNVISRSPKLKWIQAISAGVDRTLTPEIAASAVTMTNVSGMHVVPISEWVFGLILSFAKNLGQINQNQKHKKWERYSSTVLDGKTLGILGLGNIGRRVARVGKAFGMRVVATRRHVRQTGRARDVDTVYPPEKLVQLLAESDYVVDCLPHTKETERIIGEKELRAMKANSFLVNIGRGATVDEPALIRALQEKWIAGAGLDTFQREPLPVESPLWDMPNVIVTPHTSGSTDDYMSKAADIFCENLRRYLAGKRLRNIVDKKLGY